MSPYYMGGGGVSADTKFFYSLKRGLSSKKHYKKWKKKNFEPLPDHITNILKSGARFLCCQVDRDVRPQVVKTTDLDLICVVLKYPK